MYFATDAAAGQNLAYCTLPGTWTMGAGGAGVNAQTGPSYALQDGDCEKLVTFTNASAVGVTLPQAGATSRFAAGWVVDVQNRGAGNVTITPATSTIDGAASLVLTQNQGTRIFSDGSNYFTERGVGGGSSGTLNGGTGTANLCWLGATSGQTCLSVASVAGSPVPICSLRQRGRPARC
jgi:hypothetical protein